ncbi:MAG TPA: DUF1501 domain-containing protein [Drouetiella sp.]
MGISRRDFLKGGIGLYASLSVGDIFSLAAQAAPRPSTSKILVVVQLAGGNDGLNMVVPYADDAYYKARPTIGIKQKDVLQLNQAVGLHNGMPELSDLFKKGKLAVLQGVGYPEPSRSHFRSIEIWQTAEPRKVKDTGWLGRYLDLTAPAKSDPSETFFPAINVDPILPKTLSAQKVIVPSVSNVADFTFKADPKNEQDRLAQIDAFNGIYKDFKLDRKYVDQLRLVGMDTTSASDYLNKIVQNYKSTANYPNDGFGKGLKFIAQMIVGGVNCKIYNITLGGFDTHTNEGRNQDQLLRRLSTGLSAFQQDLEAHNKDSDVVVMTFSEFGRRVAENGGRGTDHGTAAPMLVLGSGIKGGVIGDHPSLTSLEDGDLKYKMDFRTVYATILDRWLAADSKAVLGDKFDQIPLFV